MIDTFSRYVKGAKIKMKSAEEVVSKIEDE